MAHGKKITLYLVDGSANSIIKGDIMGWSAKATVLKRTQLIDLASDTDIKHPGIYILAGPDLSERYAESVYIGESENVWGRLKKHEQDESKEHYERVVVINDSLTKSHLRYLESRLISMAVEAGRATVGNGTAPELPPLPAADCAAMEEFLENVKLLLPALGYNFAIPAPRRSVNVSAPKVTDAESPVFRLDTKRQGISVVATAQVINSEFVILEGSTAVLSMEGGYKHLKQQLIEGGSLVIDGGVFRFSKDVPFNSPSGAAAVVRGQNTNGRIYWRLDNGKTYGEWLDGRIAEKEGLPFPE